LALGLFAAGSLTVQLASVHLYFGTTSATSLNRRRLETLAVAEWAERRRKSRFASTPNILPLGDFNLPKPAPGAPIFDELTSRGLHLADHATQIGSSIADPEIALRPDRLLPRADGGSLRHLWRLRLRRGAVSDAV
jgi:hypothetical protein